MSTEEKNIYKKRIMLCVHNLIFRCCVNNFFFRWFSAPIHLITNLSLADLLPAWFPSSKKNSGWAFFFCSNHNGKWRLEGDFYEEQVRWNILYDVFF